MTIYVKSNIPIANFIKNLVKRIYNFPKLVNHIMMNIVICRHLHINPNPK